MKRRREQSAQPRRRRSVEQVWQAALQNRRRLPLPWVRLLYAQWCEDIYIDRGGNADLKEERR
jgi:hypothetical protein